MTIGDVLSILKPEFPRITMKKLRSLEEMGVIHPFRTAAGYRRYDAADVERIRDAFQLGVE
jgi:DNA-binding transcriptional MerR regulator